MTPLEDHLYNVGMWVSKKFNLHIRAPRVATKSINQGEVWMCDLGFNIGQEKNKERPVVVVSNNRINRTGKVVVACITDAVGKMNIYDKPIQNTWFFLYSSTTDLDKMFKPGRRVSTKAISYSFLRKDSIVQCEEIRSVSKIRLTNYMGNIDPSDLNMLKTKLKATFNIV